MQFIGICYQRTESIEDSENPDAANRGFIIHTDCKSAYPEFNNQNQTAFYVQKALTFAPLHFAS